MSSEKVISVRREGTTSKVFYREKLIGIHIDGDSETLAAVVEAAVDELIARQQEKLGAETIFKLAQSVHAATQQAYKEGIKKGRSSRPGLMTRIFGF